MKKAKRCMRRVVDVVTMAGGRVRVNLECGHQQSRRESIPVPARVWCRMCEEQGVEVRKA